MNFLTYPFANLQQQLNALNASGVLALQGAGGLVKIDAIINAAGAIVLQGESSVSVQDAILHGEGALILQGAGQLSRILTANGSGALLLQGDGQLYKIQLLSASGALILEGNASESVATTITPYLDFRADDLATGTPTTWTDRVQGLALTNAGTASVSDISSVRYVTTSSANNTSWFSASGVNVKTALDASREFTLCYFGEPLVSSASLKAIISTTGSDFSILHLLETTTGFTQGVIPGVDLFYSNTFATSSGNRLVAISSKASSAFLYNNGNTFALTGAAPTMSASVTFYIGRYKDTDIGFDCRIRAVQLYDVALTAAELDVLATTL